MYMKLSSIYKSFRFCKSKGRVKRRMETFPFESYYRLGSSSSADGFGHELESMDMINGGAYTILSNLTVENKSISASKSHSEAERRRRERINGHLQTLRTLLPSTIKSDKASLLAEVVHKVRELNKLAADQPDLTAKSVDRCNNRTDRNAEKGDGLIPGETDELLLSYCDSGESSSTSPCNSSRIRVSMSCEDRVELAKDLNKAVKSVQGRVVKAEMSTIGGRTKSVLVIERRGGGEEEEYLSMLRRSLKSVMEKPSITGAGQVWLGNKRHRGFSRHF